MTDAPASLQDLLPKWAHFCLYIERFVVHELDVDLTGAHVLVGASGGVDSTALLFALAYLAPRNDMRVSAVHLDHQLRPAAEADRAWVEELCASLGIDCHSDACDVAALAERHGVGVEEAGRNARYRLYAETLDQTGADFVALGHHLGDLSEDVLMRFIRGAGWPGLAGMTGYDPDRKLIRPLLTLPKSTLIAFVKHLGVQWREDETNAARDAARNRVRHELLPLVLRENPNFPDAVARMWKIGRLDADYWDEMTGTPRHTLAQETLESQHQAVRLRRYKSCLDALGPGQALAHTLFKLDEAWREGHVGATLQFPGDKTASVTSEGVVFTRSH